MNGSRSELQDAGNSIQGHGRHRIGIRSFAFAAFGLLVAALALGSCKPAVSPAPTEHPDGTATLPATETATSTSTKTATPTTVPMFAPGLDFTLGTEWPVIDRDTASSVALLYTHTPVGLIEVLGSADWAHMALITTDRTALLATHDLSPVGIIEIGDYGELVAAAMDARILVMAFREGGVRLFEVPSGAQKHMFDVELVQLELSPDGALLAGASVENALHVWDIESGELLHEFAIEGMASNLTFSLDGGTLAVELVGGPFEGIELWSIESGERMRQLEWADRAGPLYFVRISPAWTMAAWVSRASVLLMDVASGEGVALLGHEDFVDETEFSPDGGILVTTSAAQIEGEMTGVVNLWNAVSGDEISMLVHGDAAVLVAFSPDGSVLATATYDGLIRLWDVASGEMLAELDGGQERVFRLFFVERGRLLVSASWEGDVHFWAVEQ